MPGREAAIATATEMRLFPTPVFKFSGLGLENQEILAEVLGEKPFTRNTTSPGNYTSEDDKLQENRRLGPLVEVIIAKAREVVGERLGYAFEDLAISTMWCNLQRPEPAASHYPHEHANSLLSGTYYAEVGDGRSPISFYSPIRVKMIALATKQPNDLNSARIEVPVETGDLLLWPSELQHAVMPYQGNNRRVSISFNIMTRGMAGETGWNYRY